MREKSVLEQSLNQAIQYHRAGQLTQAERAYADVLSKSPGNFKAMHMLGLIQFQLGKTADALKLIGAALDTQPNDPNALANYALVLQSCGRLGEALEYVNRSLALAPHSADVLSNQGNIFMDSGRIADALKSYTSALAINPSHVNSNNNFGSALFRLNRFADAIAYFDKVILNNPGHIEALCNRGIALRQLKRFNEALASTDRALALKPTYIEALNNRGEILLELARYQESINCFEELLKMHPDHVGALLNRGIAMRLLGRVDQSISSFQSALAIDPNNSDVHFHRGLSLNFLACPREALDSFDYALKLNPNFHEAALYRGRTLKALGRLDDALAAFDALLKSNPNNLAALNDRGGALQALHRHEEAIAAFDFVLSIDPHLTFVLYNRAVSLRAIRSFDEAIKSLDHIIASDPTVVDAYICKGNVFRDQARPFDAVKCFEMALSLDPHNVDVHVSLGNILWDLQRLTGALECYDNGLRIQPGHADALNNRGNVLRKLKRLEEALDSFELCLESNPDHPYAFSGLADTALHLSDWKRTELLRSEVITRVAERKSVLAPLTFLGYCSDPDLQLRCANNYVHDKILVRPQPLWNGQIYNHSKIRLAYISSDFCRHATSFLIAELIERHDRDSFETIGVSFGVNDNSDLRRRLVNAFDHFIDVNLESDQTVAELLRSREIDIVVDLKGHTQDSRPVIFGYRPAPVQVNYLGYPGTTGYDCMDYIIADEIVLPFDQQPFFSEKIVHLPNCYQATDTTRNISANKLTRRDVGLPADGFVFCCFNHNWKITPQIFEIWMRLLHNVPQSVLWLIEDNSGARMNICDAAARQGINPKRLIFSAKIKMEDHLERHNLADLFLDTLPINAHTTASDALWAGLPILTCRGNAFAARVAASLLCAIDLPELVTDSLEQYEAAAMNLAMFPERLQRVRDKLRRRKRSAPLFDIARFRQHIEAAYRTMSEIAKRGEKPRSFRVPDQHQTSLSVS
jgi:protein O-GlcNAc transferase